MTDWRPHSELEKAIASVAECELQFRRAQATVSDAGAAWRRAVRTAECAQGAFENATRRLTRIEVPMRNVG